MRPCGAMIARKVYVPLWLLALGFAPECAPAAAEEARRPCQNCISSTFTCRRRCTLQGSQTYDFDFTYPQSEGACRERIPVNDSAMLLDVDVWCAYPKARACRTRDCFQPLLGCDNMVMYTYSGVAMLENCEADTPTAQDFAHESCSWVCKGGRPFARCTLNFDPENRHGLGGQMQGCWLSESCDGPFTAKLAASCEPEVPPPVSAAARVRVSGKLTLLVLDPAFLLAPTGGDKAENARRVAAALTEALAKVLPDIEPGMLEMIRLRRNRDLDVQWGNRKAVELLYAASVPTGSASDAYRAMGAVPPELMARMTSLALMRAGVGRSSDLQGLTVSNVEVTGMKAEETESPVNKELDKAALVQKSMQTRIKDIIGDLANATAEFESQDADKDDSTAAKVKGALDDMRELLTSLEQRSAETLASVEAAMQEKNSAERRVEEARFAETRILDALAEAMREAAARKQHEVALDAKSEQTYRRHQSVLGNANASADDLMAVSEALRLSVHELAEARRNTSAASKDVAELQQRLHDVRRQLLQARSQAEVLSEIDSTKKTQQDQSDELQRLTDQLSELRRKLYLSRSAHAAKSGEVDRLKSSLDEAIDRHEETLARLINERAAHSQTRQDLEEQTNASDFPRLVMLIVIAVLLVVVLSLVAAVVVLVLRRRQWVQSALNAQTGAGEEVVMGRPLSRAPPSLDATTCVAPCRSKAECPPSPAEPLPPQQSPSSKLAWSGP
eukprot:TRINITY_DN37473_c0_g1_i1.p1 TRINITY_DN37473_c0_g1~~TRINITY_DN37473_c0_g1_i1.p1  ORF type:complete len:733 (+),score=196.13 TRINITY_DN37473_c0_g1_i1:62-2260(+)